uniref:Uncharacterized protein n=1 Tax=Myoviridae sp. ctMne5 TaxID=2825089 RepID=A0A8S5TZV1_9CAUD|nr:MAG TPA: hypothetical protein [Myoviridae sp. ctMne5]
MKNTIEQISQMTGYHQKLIELRISNNSDLERSIYGTQY